MKLQEYQNSGFFYDVIDSKIQLECVWKFMKKITNRQYGGIFFAVLLLGIFPVITFQDAFSQESSIPEWVKSNAGWWADGTIDDTAFIQGIQFLIKEGIMKIPETEITSQNSDGVPAWIKNNAGWWADGTIDDTAFIQGIQFLVGQGIISLQSDSQSTDEPKINSEPLKTSGNVVVQKDMGHKVTDTKDRDWYKWRLIIEDGSNTPVPTDTILSVEYLYPDGTIEPGAFVVSVDGFFTVRGQYGEQPNAKSIIITDIAGYTYKEEFNLVIK